MELNDENVARLEALIDEANAAKLMGADWITSMGPARCCEGYNGIGPEFLRPNLRAKVTDFLALFEPAAVIHDMRNEFADGTRASFAYANSEFRHNCILLAERAYPGRNQRARRLAAKAAALILFDFVSAEKFGWRAWLEAHDRYISHQGLRPELHHEKPTENCKDSLKGHATGTAGNYHQPTTNN